MKIKNAKIRSTMLGRENHGIMTFMIYISADGFDCGIGGYWLDEFNSATQTRVFRAESMEAISKVLEVVGVDKSGRTFLESIFASRITAGVLK